MMKKLEKYCLVLVKYYLELPALVSYCIEPVEIALAISTEMTINQS